MSKNELAALVVVPALGLNADGEVVIGVILKEKHMLIHYDDFAQVDIRVGKIVVVEDFPRARKPAYKVQIDFGPEIGLKWSSVQAKREYTQEEMLGRQVLGVVNFAPKNIAGFLSEVLILGVPAEDGSLSLLMPSRPAQLGSRIY